MYKAYPFFRKLNNGLMKCESVFIGLGAIALTVLVLIAVLCRYALYIATPWADELSRYVFVWVAFVGAGYVTGKWDHIDVQLIDTIIRQKAKDPQKSINLMIKISKAVSLIVLCIFSVLYIQYMLRVYPSKSTALRIPMSIPLSSAMVGLILMSIQCLCVLILPEEGDK